MRFKLLTLAALLLSAVSAFAHEPRIRDIDVSASLQKDGSAIVTEKWDVTVASGTEWYLVRSNLGVVDIKDLSVSDENGQFTNIGKWDIDASLKQKTGKCGLNPANKGYEICWGVGSYGDHKYTVSYRLTDAVDILNDADCFHFQMVSPGLSSTPEHVKVSISVPGVQLDSSLVKFWGFGNGGATYIEDGAICFEASSSKGEYTRSSSVITLVRFEKGIFEGGNVWDKTFEKVLQIALIDADFGTDEEDDEDTLSTILGAIFVLGFLFLIFVAPWMSGPSGKPSKRDIKKILGCKAKDVTWSREIPYEGDLFATDYTLGKIGEKNTNSNLASAIMLRMIYKGVLDVRKSSKGIVDFVINPSADTEYMHDSELGFLDMLKEAAGGDAILQDKEFSKWAGHNTKKVYNWSKAVKAEGPKALSQLKCTLYTPNGQKKAREALGFKKFLKDFTRMKEKQSIEAVLWQEYLVFAAMFGIADKVAKEMKDINPDLFTRTVPTATNTFTDIYTMTNAFGRSMANAINLGRPQPTSSYSSYGSSSSSWSGGGGHSSFGGGGGYHGGGHGGGSR